ncbi:golgin subfamily A member 2-like [Xenopus laevis]|uniref:Golgin subfamily A member 2-like n=1 Tax=Xenopus laevis TaxID=8355 RepID=A0A8J1LR59_XENLA|nr:golgin subfamily A member 2-like [Xenopus laevis]
MKANLLELQVLVIRLVTERNEWYRRLMEATQGPQTGSEEFPAENPMELEGKENGALEEVGLEEDGRREVQSLPHLAAPQERLNPWIRRPNH